MQTTCCEEALRVVFVCDTNYLMQTSVAIHSLIKHLAPKTACEIAIILPARCRDVQINDWSRSVARENVVIQLYYTDTNELDTVHEYDPNAICVASPAALLKFKIADILSQWDKALYLDGDILVKEDITPLWQTNLDDKIIGAVIDSGTIYWKHEYAQRVQHYFNSGVMLMNLEKMRREKLSELLITTKRNTHDSMLMDQNVFNLVLDDRVKLLPVKWNCLFVNLIRAKDKFTIDDLNQTYSTNYETLNQLANDSAIIHYSSKDKPWLSQNTPLHGAWYREFLEAQTDNTLFLKKEPTINIDINTTPIVSIIIPVYNTEPYLEDAIGSIMSQTLNNIEIICIDDGSTDQSLETLNFLSQSDSRIKVLHKENGGQSSARNLGLEVAQGKYIYFFDSDDFLKPTSLDQLVNTAESDRVDIVFFDGETIYDTPQLAQEYPQFAGLYTRHSSYLSPSSGETMFIEMNKKNEYLVQPCLMFFKRAFIEEHELRFEEGIVHEDNIFIAVALLRAKRVSRLAKSLFQRRIRQGSTMTSRDKVKDYTAFFTCSVRLYMLAEHSPLLKPEALAILNNKAFSFLNRASEYYWSLKKNERFQPAFLEPEAHFASNIIFNAMISRKSVHVLTSKELSREYQRGKEAVKNSRSWKVGRAITYIPRLLKRLLKAFNK